MDKDSTTDATDDQQTADDEPVDNQQTQDGDEADSKATTDQQTADTGDDDDAGDEGDDLDASKSTDDTSADDDKSDDEEEDDDAPASDLEIDDDLDEWAEKTGRKKPETDAERQDLQTVRNSRREYSKEKQQQQAAKDVEKSIDENKPDGDKGDDDDVDPLKQELSDIKATQREERSARLRSEYFTDRGVTTEEADAMGAFLKEKIDKAPTPQAKQQAHAFWTDPANLEEWHTIAQARVANSKDPSEVADEAARAERKRIAKEHQAKGPKRSASKTTPKEEEGYKTIDTFSDWDDD